MKKIIDTLYKVFLSIIIFFCFLAGVQSCWHMMFENKNSFSQTSLMYHDSISYINYKILCDSAISQGYPSIAKTYLDKLQKFKYYKNDDEFYNLSGHYYFLIRNYTEAIYEYQKAVSIRYTPEYDFNMGICYEQLYFYANAGNCFRRVAIYSNYTDEEAIYLSVICYGKSSVFDRACEMRTYLKNVIYVKKTRKYCK
jgi:tetratricopeptide (TPR) repeat protein